MREIGISLGIDPTDLQDVLAQLVSGYQEEILQIFIATLCRPPRRGS